MLLKLTVYYHQTACRGEQPFKHLPEINHAVQWQRASGSYISYVTRKCLAFISLQMAFNTQVINLYLKLATCVTNYQPLRHTGFLTRVCEIRYATFPEAADALVLEDVSVGLHGTAVPTGHPVQVHLGLESNLHHICGLSEGHGHGPRGAASQDTY